MREGRAVIRWFAALVVGAAAVVPAAARADGWSLQVEPGYSASTTDTTGEGGDETRTEQTSFSHRYRGSVSRTILPYVSATASGGWEGLLASTTTEGLTTDSEQRRWNAAARLSLGPPILGGSLAYTRRQSESHVDAPGVAAVDAPALVGQTYAANLYWRPLGAPSFDLILSRSEIFDTDRALQDQVSTEVGLSATYREIQHWDLRGAVRYANPVDRLKGTESRDLSEVASVAWDDRFFQRRLSAAAGYTISRRDTETTASRADAVFLTLQSPFEGLSLVEPALADPTSVTLVVNRALVDGDLEASAGLDIGPSVRLAGDTRRREIGARFADPRTPVSLIHVFVDRQLPTTVWSAFVWSAWASDDNVTWRPVAVDRAGIRFGLFDNRFEIPIARTEARYVKLVVEPLLPGVTTSPELANILVTEVRTYLSEAAAAAVGRSSDTSGAFTGSVRALLDPSYNLAYDGGVFLRHGDTVAWSTSSGLAAGRRLGKVSSWGARVERTDSGVTDGEHSAVSRASVSLASDPLPTLGGVLTGGAVLTQTKNGTGWSAASSAIGRAELYTGVALSASGGAGVSESEDGRQTQSAQFSASASVNPHPTTMLNAGYALSLSRVEGTGWDRRSRVEGSGSYSPFPALSLSGSIARSLEGARPTTLATFSANASPLPGGQLVLRFGYTESLDTGSDTRTRQWGPALRFTIRPGSHLDTSYSTLRTRTGALETDSRALLANLVITVH